MSNTGKVYSYLRFSAAKQAMGASADRQTDYAKKWATVHGLTLDESLSMRDEGLSAFHQKHVRTGALGIFLEAIAAGKIPSGSVLVVEGLDRLSRAEPILAQNQLTQIILAGISVVTASDNKVYSREELKRDPMGLIYSILIIIRANEESDTKSKRVSDALRRKCEAWVAGTYRGKISCGADPSWVRWNGSAYELEPEMSETIRIAALMFSTGYGGQRIIQELTSQGRKVTGMNQPSNINQLMGAQHHLFSGKRIVKASGTEYHLEGYYPALLNEEEYSRLILALEERKGKPRNAGGKTLFPSIITGLKITSCGECGTFVVSRNQARKPKKNGATLNRRICCPKCEIHGEAGSGRLDAVEKAVLEYCSDQLNLDALTTSVDTTGALRSEKAAIAIKVADLSQRLGKMLDAALDDAAGLPQVIVSRMRDMERQIAQAKARDVQIAAELSLAAKDGNPATAFAWKAIKDAVIAMDYDARMICRKLVSDTFSAIQVYFRGTFDAPLGVIDVVLVSKAGVSRSLRLDQRTGELITGKNFDRNAA